MEMTPETWEKVKVLYEAALERPAEQRIRYLTEACPQDDLRTEVLRLLANLEKVGSFPNQPLITDPDPFTTESEDGFLSSGQILADRFKLKKFIARGGMGEVYEAEDLELQERVALKLVRPELLLDSHAMQRFKREVHLAKKVTHPSVCRTFDLFRHHGTTNGDRNLIFISMELLAGETLSQYLRRRGRLSSEESLPLITQVAGGMEAAHKVGVIHRDFKPGNIILVSEGTNPLRVVITDFGLALRSGGDGTTVELSASHGIAGTPAYMAPEQIEGREVTTATDIYAFGLVVYEMLTGSLPFAAETPLGRAARRLQEPIPSPRAIVPDFDASWEPVILRCLEREPSKRFASISEVVPALTQRESAERREPKAQSERVYRRILAFAALLLLVVGITIYARRARNAEDSPLSGSSSKSGSSPVKMRPSVAVLGFRNVSKRSDKDWLSGSFTEALNSELSEGGQLRLVSGESVARMKIDLSLPDSDSYAAGTLRQIRQSVTADYVIQGSFLDLGDQTNGQIRVDVRLQDARSGETVDSVIENGNEADLNGLLVKTGADLRQKLKVNAPSAEQQTQSRAALPKNLQAARYYAEGLQKLRAFDSLGARDSLEMAVEKEPTFALAYSALAAAWTNLGYDAKARDSAKKAVELSTNLDDENRQWIQAQFHEASHDQAQAVATYEVLFRAHPDNLEYGLRLLAAMVRGGQAKSAQSIADVLKALPAPASNDPRVDLLSANAAFVTGDYRQAVILAKAAETKAESSGARLTLALALMRRGAALQFLGQKREAVELDEKALRIFAEAGDRDDVAKVNANMGGVLNEEANYAEGMKRQKESLEEFRRIGDRRGEALALSQLGWAALAQDRLDEAQSWYERALRMERELGGEGAGVIAQLAVISSYKGDLSGATARNEQVLAIAKETGNLRLEAETLINLVGLYITRGELRTAKDLNAQADAIFAKTGGKRGTAQALGHWGHILAIENNLDGARQRSEKSLMILAESDETLLPYGQMSLASLEIEQGDTSEAEALLTQVINYFHSQKNDADEGWAMGIYARAELESGNIAAAERKAKEAKALCVHDQTGSSVGVRLFAARVEGLAGNHKAADTELKNFLRMAERQGNVELEFDARLALGEIALKSHDPAGHKILSDLSKDAASKGFLLVSHKADSLLSNHSTP